MSLLLARIVQLHRTPAPSSTYYAAVMADSPVAYWRLGETSGTTASDSSGNGHHATFGGTYTLGNASLMPGGSGKSFQSAALANIAIPSGWINTVQSPLSIEAFVNIASFSNSPNIFATYNNGFSVGVLANGYLEVSNPGVRLNANDTTALLLNTNYHVCVTWDAAGLVKFYINGVLSSSYSSGNAAGAGVDPAFIGAYNGLNNATNGYIQEVAIYNSVLSASRIAAHYAAA